jgi:hypothetical protein
MARRSQKDAADTYSEEESDKRMVAALRGARLVPHKTYEESKVGKAKAKRAASPKSKNKAPPKRG